MKAKHKWHKTTIGRVILFLGSIKSAIPVLFLSAIALIYGTWIESSQSADEAKQIVYGSWWFVTLMALICVILVLAVVTRYPWRKKHTGFIIVHASLITVIIAGFYTFNTKVEGEIALKEGTSASALRLGTNELQLLSHHEGQFDLIDSTLVDETGTVQVNGVNVHIEDVWENTAQETVVLDDGLNKLHAIEMKFDDDDQAYWVGQLRDGESAPQLHGVEIRVLEEGVEWKAPGSEDEAIAILRSQDNEIVELLEEGSSPSDGWSIESVRRFKHALVGSDGLEEGDSGRDNPGVEVVLAHTDGSREVHAAFDRFRGTINKKQLEGETFSDLVLEYRGQGLDRPVFAVVHDGEHGTAWFSAPGIETQSYPLVGDGPWDIPAQDHVITILHDYTNARGTSELVEAPVGPENSPAIRVIVEGIHSHDEDTNELMTLVWGQRSVVQIGEEVYGISYAPSQYEVPFTVELIEFRKEDYPGSEMAMAYESDVVFTDDLGETREQRIYMNNPLEHDGWKIYQAGFVGEDVSIFQVTKDPGLKAMYLGCIGLCFGILVMYYSKAYSHGHPGMPKVFDSKKTTGKKNEHSSGNKRSVPNAKPEHHADDRDVDRVDFNLSSSDGSTGGGAEDGSGVEIKVGSHPDPTSRSHDADGHLREKGRRRSHRTHKVG